MVKYIILFLCVLTLESQANMHRRARHFNARDAGADLVLDSRFITGLADGDPVSTWSDRSGNANDATGVGAARPEYKINIQGGSPVVRFDAIDDGMSTNCNLNNPFTIIYTGRTISGISNRTILSRDQNRVIAYNRSSNGVFNGATVVNSTQTTPGTNVAIGTLVVGATSAFFANGSDITTGTTGTGNWGRLSFGFVGVNFTIASADVSQVLGLPMDLSPALRRRIEHAAAFSFKIPCN